MKTVQAYTFTPLYDEVEDRVKLIVNYQDFENRVEFMITRRFMIKLIPTLEDFYTAQYGKSQDNIIIDKNNNEFISKTKAEDISFYKKDELLLTEVNISLEKPYTILQFKSSNITAVGGFDAISLDAFIKNLIKSIPKLEWGVLF